MKTILITGASSGIGRATAELFLGQGWRVGLVARRADRLAEIADAHPNAVALPADVTDATAMRGAFDTFGHIDVLFNNAGLFGVSGPIDEIPLEIWTEVMQVNINGMFIAAQLAFERMRAQKEGGRIINNGSLSAYVPRPGSVCYTMSKHAVTGLTRTLSLDGRPFNIACGQIDIGNAESELVAGLKAANPEMDTMDVKHAASSVLHMAQMPPEANVQFMTVMATKMPYIGRG
ncbi:SDR family oxidoreductase [Sulfitobacter sp. CW3]|uniref:SDR family oxidoreductase n=1 Tax=Sulfitobacter sp. CW3 TaxID=2861965 RepID=UPI001C5FAB44|nr:SDR family oxidoreductase [Sulfitobacter sp. CW3]MBW4961264.1 SDR family oxidoreductase [Sulfitobacter sp. CW3]|tara:strand:+ start:30255 stop:30953 length:699 start_codon:yes stop_codon:yes gene_type:complete